MKEIELMSFANDTNHKNLLERLLQKNGEELYLDSVLNSLSYEDKKKLYQYIKYHYYYYFHIIERDIIEIYKRHGLNLKPVFIEYPTVKECTYKGDKKLNSLLEEFKLAYSDTDEATINYFISEFRKKARYDSKRTCCDIMRLINIKREYPNFKLIVENITSYDPSRGFGSSNNDHHKEKYIRITRHEEADFTHELSETLYNLSDPNNSDVLEFNDICDFLRIPEEKAIISEYLEDFKQRYMSTWKHFQELYYKEIEKRFGSFSAYCEHLKQDILDSKTDVVVITNDDGTFVQYPITPDTVDKCVGEILNDEGNLYINLCIKNYYIEERSLVTILDAMLSGAIGEGELSDFHPACHNRERFYGNQHGPFMESLAAYEVIKYSPRADVLISKLKELIGEVLVEIMENHINSRRIKEPEGFVYEKVGKDN